MYIGVIIKPRSSLTLWLGRIKLTHPKISLNFPFQVGRFAHTHVMGSLWDHSHGLYLQALIFIYGWATAIDSDAFDAMSPYALYIVNTVLCWQHFSRLVPAVPGGSVGHGCTYLDPNWVLRFRIKMIRNFFKLLKGYKTFGNYCQTSSNHIKNTIHATYKISNQTKNQKPRYDLINFL